MNDNIFHAVTLATFVVLCIGAASQGGREQATQMAAQRIAKIAAQQAVRSQPAARPAMPHAGIERTSAAQ